MNTTIIRPARVAGIPNPGETRHRGPRLLLRVSDLFSIEASFVLFLFSGRYKVLPEMKGFPIDFTILFFAVTLCLVAAGLMSGRLRLRFIGLPILLMVSFTELVITSLFWSSFQPFNIDKALRFAGLTSTSFLIAYLVAQQPHRRERFMRILVWFSITLLLYYCYYRFVLGINPTELNYQESRTGLNYQEYGEHATILFIAYLSVAVFGSIAQLCVSAVGCGFALYLLAIMGGRGALAFALMAVPLLAAGLVLRARESVGRLARLTILLSLLGAFIGTGLLAMSAATPSEYESQFRTLYRFKLQLTNEETSSMDARVRGRQYAISQWLRKPLFGWGIGEFRVEDNWLKYPHNLPLEMLMELGLIGAFLFFWVIAIDLVACVRIAVDPATGWAETAIGLFFLTQLASELTVEGNLADDRIFLAYMGLVIIGRIAGRRPQTLPTSVTFQAARG